MAVKLVISGCCGRMGQAIARCALDDPRVTLSAVFERPDHPAIGRDYRELLGDPPAAGLKVLGNAQEAIGLVFASFASCGVCARPSRGFTISTVKDKELGRRGGLSPGFRSSIMTT